MDEVVAQLRAARKWIDLLITEMDIDPDDTAFHVNAVSKEGKRQLARITLSESIAKMDAALASVQHSGTGHTSP